MITTRRRRAGALCALLACGAASAQVRFEIAFDDPAGLNAAHHGDLERLALAAGADWANHFVTPAGPLTLSVEIGFGAISTATGRSLTSGFLHTDAIGRAVYEQGAAYELRTGIDPNAGAADIEIVFGNLGYLQQELWFDPLQGPVPAAVPSERTDAYSVLLHEFGHAFGFNGWRDAVTGELPGDYLSSFDALVEWRPSDDGIERPFFTGASASLAHGQAVPLTLGNYGHLGGTTDALGRVLAPDLMNGLYFDRGARYTISALDLDILRDIGLPMAAPVPEAGTATLLLLGLAGLGAAARRRAGRLALRGTIDTGARSTP